MIANIKNRWLRGLAVWALVLAGVIAFPFVVLFGGAVDAFRAVKSEWRGSKSLRDYAWRLMTFRSVE